MTDVPALIARFGGVKAVASRFGLTRKSVEQWESREGIPGKWHIPLLLWAAEIEVPLSVDDLSSRPAEAAEVRA